MEHGLEWVEDKTNRDRRYLRNRIRAQLGAGISDADRRNLKALRDKQVALVAKIAAEERSILHSNSAVRHLLTQIDQSVATDVLGAAVAAKLGVRPTRPQLERALIAVKTAKPGAVHHIGNKACLRFESRFFSVEVL